MKMKSISMFLSFLLIPAIVFAGSFPKGAYTQKINDAQFNLTLKSDSAFTIELIGQFTVAGTYLVSSDTVIVEDRSGESSCPTPGKYVWKYENHSLKFTLVSDECEGRARALEAGLWSKKQ